MLSSFRGTSQGVGRVMEVTDKTDKSGCKMVIKNQRQRRNNLNREIEEIERKLKHLYQTEERQLEQKAIQEIRKNPKYFFTYAKSKAKTTASIGLIRTSEGSYTEDDKEISETLKKPYEDMYSTPINNMKVEDPDNFFVQDIQTPVNITDINTNVLDFEREIENMSMHSVPGPDSWNSIFIKKCKVPVAQALKKRSFISASCSGLKATRTIITRKADSHS
ncbi:uncharacterized protein [Procambarus clarkii]|uniref:uncharacterized protein n=1 Tax=Procambarus clarkii TaxID=6728 RepID=UPI003744A116